MSQIFKIGSKMLVQCFLHEKNDGNLGLGVHTFLYFCIFKQ